jgi:hypothetical protein
MKEYYDKPAVSNSGMKFINPEEGGTPARYKKAIVDREKEEESTPSLENGKLIHLYVEKPSDFIISDVSRPTAKLGEWADMVWEKLPESWDEGYITKDNKTLEKLVVEVMPKYGNTTDATKLWNKFQECLDYLRHRYISSDDLCITPAQRTIVENCIYSLQINKKAKELLFQQGEDFGDKAYNELAIYWKEKLTIDGEDIEIPCKGLIDRLQVYPSKKLVHLIDLKTTGKAVSKFNSSFEYYRYYRQMAWYMRAVSVWLQEQFPDENTLEWKISVTMVVVETSGLYECKVYDVDPSWTSKGTSESIDLLGRIAFATITDDWTQTLEEVGNNGVLLLKVEDGE